MNLNLRLFSTLTLALWLVAAQAAEVPLWNQSLPLGQWRAFGAGMLQAKAAGTGLVLDVDWTATTFGVGAVFESGGDLPPFPGLQELHTLSVDAKTTVADGTILVPEWVLPGTGQDVRVAPAHQASLTDEWQTFTFQFPDDFPGFSSKQDHATALRLLFLNKDKPGRGTVLFRNVRLEP